MKRLLPAVLFSCLSLAVIAAPSESATLEVKGMDCAACPLTVKAVLKRQPGVDEVKVDMKSGIARLTFDSSKVSREKLARAVTEAGFPTTPRK